MAGARTGGALGRGPARVLFATSLGVALVYLPWFLWAAWGGWFAYDDFVFMARVREAEPWSWLDPLAAVEEPFFFFFRPLGMESFYYAGLRLFGLEVLGFRLLALATHLATSALLFRLGRQLGFGRPAALAAAMLSLTSAPGTHVLFEGYSFQYTSALFFTAASVSLFLDHLRGGGRLALLGSAVAVACGMLCNEAALAASVACGLLALRHEGRLDAAALGHSVLRLLPHLLVAAPLLAVRVAVIEQFPIPSAYQMVFGWNLAEAPLRYLAYALGPGPMLRGRMPFSLLPVGLAAALVMLALAVALRSVDGRRRAHQWLLPLSGVLLGWALAAVAPFAPIVAAHARYAAPVTLPLALALGALVDLCLRASPPARERWVAGATSVLLVASLPYGTFRDRHDNREGPRARRLYELVGEDLAREPGRVRVFVLHGGSELAGPLETKRWQWLTYGSEFLRASFPERHRNGSVVLHWVDVAERLPRARMLDSCVLLAIDRDGEIARVDRPLAERLLPPDLIGRCTLATP